jgi:transmembrane sensor
MQKNTDWQLLSRYLAGECSPQDEERIGVWIRSDPEHEKLVQTLKSIWKSPAPTLPESDLSQLWRDTAAKAGILPQRKRRKISPFLRLLPYAAFLLAAILIPLTIWKISPFSSNQTPVPELTQIVVNPGEQKDLTLPDGAEVKLDAGSSFEYPQEFPADIREVYLSGEGLFNVPSDPGRPFLIHANGALIQVVGTRFNVRAWQKNKTVEVAVSDGKVSLRPESDGQNNAVVVEAGQISIIAEGRPPSEPRSVDIEKYLGWLNKEADFVDVPLNEILFQLERWYNLRFVLRDKSIADEHLTVFIENRTVNEILTLIAALTGQEFERRGNLVILRPAD